jgi:hypothetical protein
MPDNNKIDDTQLKLYQLLVDQHQKLGVIVWQLPTALLVANAFVMDKFQAQPWILLALALIDGVLTYAYHRTAIQQRAIGAATKAAEEFFIKSGYDMFIPKFTTAKISGSLLVVYMLWIFAGILCLFSLIHIF